MTGARAAQRPDGAPDFEIGVFGRAVGADHRFVVEAGESEHPADQRILPGRALRGNVAFAARATGFTPKTAYNRRDRLPAFSRMWEQMLDEAQPRLDARLTAEALKGDWTFKGEIEEPGEPETFDVDLALRLLTWRDKRQRRRARAEKE